MKRLIKVGLLSAALVFAPLAPAAAVDVPPDRPGQPASGDFNGDGRRDQITMLEGYRPGDFPAGVEFTCYYELRLANWYGKLGAPQRKSLKLTTSRDVTGLYCPDADVPKDLKTDKPVTIDFNGNRRDEVLLWFNDGPNLPITANGSLMAWEPASNRIQPIEDGMPGDAFVTDLNGDGRQDLINSWSAHPRRASVDYYVSDARGKLVQKVSTCLDVNPKKYLADMDGRRGLELLTGPCELDEQDGDVQVYDFRRARYTKVYGPATPGTIAESQIVDENHDRYLDVRVWGMFFINNGRNEFTPFQPDYPPAGN